MQTAANVEPSSSVLYDLLLFIGCAVAAYVFAWQVTDLVWGLWLSSLLVGYALIVTGVVAQAIRQARGSGALGPIIGGTSALFLLAFFTVHFGGFHAGHAVFLFQFYPFSGLGLAPGQGLDGELYDVDLAKAFWEQAKSSWPLVLSSLIASRETFRKAKKRLNLGAPYLNVVRMHLLIFVFAFLGAANVDGYVVYVIVLFFYFFPWRTLLAWRKGRKVELPLADI